MPKIAIFDAKPYDRPAFEREADRCGFQLKFFETRLTSDTVSLARGFDAVVPFVNDEINAPVIDALCDFGVKIVAMRCAGYNNVDIDHANGRIAVARVPAYSPHAVAEHAVAMLLTIVRRTHKAYIRTRDFNFSLNNMVGFDLHGKTVGVVGAGRIGKAFIEICRGFGMHILAHDAHPDPTLNIEYLSLHDLLRRSDVVSLHCPLTPETRHMINPDTISIMKKGAILINTSRGALVDTDALLSAIKSRHLGAACLDVYEEESEIFFEDRSGHIIDDDVLARLLSMPNVLITAHQAFLTEEALNNIAQTTMDNIQKALSPQTPQPRTLVTP